MNVRVIGLVLNNKLVLFNLSKNILIPVTLEALFQNNTLEEFMNVMEVINNDVEFIYDRSLLKNIALTGMDSFWKLFIVNTIINGALLSNISVEKHNGGFIDGLNNRRKNSVKSNICENKNVHTDINYALFNQGLSSFTDAIWSATPLKKVEHCFC